MRNVRVGSSAVCLGDGVFVAGAYKDDDTGTDAGTAFIFRDASWTNYGTGTPGTNGIPDFTASDDPILGSNLTLSLGNSLGVTTTGVLLIGLSKTSNDSGILVVPLWVLSITVPGPGLSLPFDLPCDSSFSNLSIYLQAVEIDSGAVGGLSLTAGMQLDLGQY